MGLADRIAHPDDPVGLHLRKAVVQPGWVFGDVGTGGDVATVVYVKFDNDGDDVPAGTNGGYSPSTGEWVWVLADLGRAVILGKIG